MLRGVPSREDNVLYPRNSFRHGDVLDEGVRGLQPLLTQRMKIRQIQALPRLAGRLLPG